MSLRVAGFCWAALSLGWGLLAQNVRLAPASTPEGYVARLLINEVPFPGDPLYRSEEDCRRGMEEIVWVLNNRLRHIPPGYSQQEVANTRAANLIEVITAPGQVEGFHRDGQGRFVAVPRVHRRVDYLVRIANDGQPGRIAALLNHAAQLAAAALAGGPDSPDLFLELRRVGSTGVTGRAYAWMTANLPDHPGGHFVAVPREREGRIAGNQFYTLTERRP